MRLVFVLNMLSSLNKDIIIIIIIIIMHPRSKHWHLIDYMSLCGEQIDSM